eukprot:12082362-Alexandrium_andersonii.AAC.1
MWQRAQCDHCRVQIHGGTNRRVLCNAPVASCMCSHELCRGSRTKQLDMRLMFLVLGTPN